MEILKRDQGIIVLNQYGKSYIRFMAGGISDKLYQIEISQEELDLVMNSSVNGELIVNRHMNLEPSLPDGLEDRVIMIIYLFRPITLIEESRLYWISFTNMGISSMNFIIMF